MNFRLIPATLLLLSVGMHQAANTNSSEVEAIPSSTAELIDLFGNVSGDDAEFAYRINFEFRKNAPKERLPQLQRALRDWVDRSSGITLTFTLDCWNRLRVETNSELSTENVHMLIGLLTDPRYTTKTARRWVSENKKYWPCRASYTVDSPETILAMVDEHHLDLLLTKASTPDAALRADIVRILGIRSVNEKTKTTAELQTLVRKHYQDPVADVREAVAYSLAMVRDCPAAELNEIFVAMLSDPSHAVRMNAIRSARRHPAIFSAQNASQMLTLSPQLTGSEQNELRSTLEVLTATESPSICDGLIKTGLAMQTDANDDTADRLIPIFAKAAQFATQNRVDQVAAQFCLEAQSDDSARQRNALHAILTSGSRFSAKHQDQAAKNSLQIMQSRRNQGTPLATLAGSTAASLIKQVNPKEQAKFVAELTRMLQKSGSTRAALRVLAKLGSFAGTSAPTIKSLTQHKQDDVRLDATAALWTIAKDTETCLPILLNGLKSESTQARNTASDTLIATGGELTRFKPQVTELLNDAETTLPMLRILERIGVDAKPLTGAIEPLTKVDSQKTKYYATRALKAISG